VAGHKSPENVSKTVGEFKNHPTKSTVISSTYFDKNNVGQVESLR